MASSNKDQLAYLGTTTVFETKDVPVPEYVQVGTVVKFKPLLTKKSPIWSTFSIGLDWSTFSISRDLTEFNFWSVAVRQSNCLIGVLLVFVIHLIGRQ